MQRLKALSLFLFLLLPTQAVRAQYADYGKKGSTTHSNLMFNMCKLNAGQGNEKVLREQLVQNNKYMNEDPAWMTDPELIESATQAIKDPGFCDSMIQANSYQAWVENQDSMGPKHFASLSAADKIIIETIATYICKYGTDDMTKFNPVAAEVNRTYSRKGIPQLSAKIIWERFGEIQDGGSLLWLASLKLKNGNCSSMP